MISCSSGWHAWWWCPWVSLANCLSTPCTCMRLDPAWDISGCSKWIVNQTCQDWPKRWRNMRVHPDIWGFFRICGNSFLRIKIKHPGFFNYGESQGETIQFRSHTKTAMKHQHLPVWLMFESSVQKETSIKWHPKMASSKGNWWYPCPLKGDIPNKYPLYKVYMGLIIKGPPSQGYHQFPYDQ